MSEIDVEKVLRMEQEFETTKRETIKHLLERQKETAEQLRALGHGSKQAKTQAQKKPCSKCKSMEHDARFHRGDSKRVVATESARTPGRADAKS